MPSMKLGKSSSIPKPPSLKMLVAQLCQRKGRLSFELVKLDPVPWAIGV